jgi:hypothetical protein
MDATAIAKLAWGLLLIGGFIWFTVWATKNGSPQHVWLFCDMLGWCK